MRIVVDAMGSDTSPEPEILASIEAARLFGDEIFLVGPLNALEAKFHALKCDPSQVSLVDAPETISMKDKGLALALKAKRKNSQTSMAVGMDMVKDGVADAFITAGNTGGALATAYYRLGTLAGVERPALTALFPVKNGFAVVLDIGANPDCKPEHLAQFAVMGSVYAQKRFGISHPRIGLLSNGEEPGKGNELVKLAYPLIEKSGLNFFGNVEGKELFGAEVEVVVADGFSGNILLKTSEAVAKLIVDQLREELTRSFRTKAGAFLAKPAFSRLKRMLDPAEIGAAPLLGINGLVFIGHGRSNSHAILSAIRTTRQAIETELLSALHNAIQDQLGSLSKQGRPEIELSV